MLDIMSENTQKLSADSRLMYHALKKARGDEKITEQDEATCQLAWSDVEVILLRT